MDSGEETRERSGWIKGTAYKFKAKVIGAAMKTKKIGKDDPRRILHSIKVGLALTLVSLFYYSRPLYDEFGSSGIWAVLTVIVIFEFTVGATLCKGINRGIATTLGGALGTGAKFVASLFGQKEEEAILLGVLVFLLAAASTFTRFFPHIKKKYDYGVVIFILTFSLVAVSGYRVDKIIELAHQRLSTIVIGGATCIIVSIFLFPVWAGQDLHNLVALNVEKLANFLEGFGGEYFKCCEDGGGVANISKDQKSFLEGYKSVLNSKPTEESLANFAWWEPGHGGFMFRHPWNQYLKIGALARQCAYQLDALNAYLCSDNLQVPTEFQRRIKKPCMKISSESGKALKELASAMKTMTCPSAANTHVQDCKIAIDDLKAAMEYSSIGKEDLLQIVPAVSVASTLIDIIKCVEEIAESVYELSKKAHFKSNPKSSGTTLEKPQLLHRGTVKPSVSDGDGKPYTVITVHGSSSHTLKYEKSNQKSTVEPHFVPHQGIVKPKCDSDVDGEEYGNNTIKTTVTPEKVKIRHRGTVTPVSDGDGDRNNKINVKSTVSPKKTQLLQQGTIKPISDSDVVVDECVVITVRGSSSDSPERGNLHASKNVEKVVV